MPNLLSYIITIFWIVGVTNAINWFDGLDGLTAGSIFLYSFALTGFCIFNQESYLAIFSSIMSGICLAFLKNNKFPASIIMGDSGSNLLGFLISILSIFTFKNLNGVINHLKFQKIF